jgi:hypothetical protein
MSPGLRQGLVAKSASTVWLLDDDPSVLKATGRLLASAGWEVERFIDPDAFLRHAEIHHPRVVVIGHCPDCKRRSNCALESVGSGSGSFFHQA